MPNPGKILKLGSCSYLEQKSIFHDEFLARVTGYLEVNCGLTPTEVANAFKHLIEKVGGSTCHHLPSVLTCRLLPPLTCHLLPLLT